MTFHHHIVSQPHRRDVVEIRRREAPPDPARPGRQPLSTFDVWNICTRSTRPASQTAACNRGPPSSITDETPLAASREQRRPQESVRRLLRNPLDAGAGPGQPLGPVAGGGVIGGHPEHYYRPRGGGGQ